MNRMLLNIERQSNKYKFIEMMNPQLLTEQLENIIDSLSANERYWFVYFKEDGVAMKDVKNTKPHLLVYQNNDQITVEQLMTYFSNEINRPDIHQKLMWQLNGGYRLDRTMKIKDIKKELRNDNIDGLIIFTRLGDLSWTDECSIKSLIESQFSFNDGVIQLPFHFKEINFIIYLPIKAKTQLEEVRNMLSIQIKRIFSVNIDAKNIKIFINIKNESRQAIIDQIVKAQEKSVQEFFSVKLLSNVVLKAPPRQNNTFLIIKGNDIESKMLHYDDIKLKKVIDVLKEIKQMPNWEQFGLLVSDEIIRYHQTFDKIKPLCKYSGKHTKHLHAYIISQAHIFQLEQERIRSKGQVDIEKIVVTNQGNLKLRQDCQNKIKHRATNTKHEWFKGNLNNVKPILLYTSEIHVKGTKGTSCSLYRTMNAFLRDQQFQKIKQDDYSKWQYRFATELLRQLKKIPQAEVKQLWRGVSYLPKHKIGEIVLFKQFNSTSSNRKKAEQFAEKALYRITKAKSCRPIKEYSYFQSQDEFLFEPYVQLKIINIGKDKNPFLKDIQIMLIEAEEVEKPQPPKDKTLFILWVDDKTNEGKLMWQNLVQIQKTTVMIQLLSTEQLQNWLKENKQIVDDAAVEMVMITNMTRVEKGAKVEKAGVHAIDTFKKYKPDNFIFVYIGWVEGTIAKLKQHNYIPNEKLRVSKFEGQIRKFLKEIGIK